MWERFKFAMLVLIAPVLGVLTVVYMLSLIGVVDWIIRGDNSYFHHILQDTFDSPYWMWNN